MGEYTVVCVCVCVDVWYHNELEFFRASGPKNPRVSEKMM